MIKIKNLSVTYSVKNEDFLALSDLSLLIPTGSTCAVIGPSGSGKSTLLRVIAGIIQKYAGSVLLNEQPIDPHEVTIGFIPQNYGLLPWKTVEENIELGVKLKKGTRGLDALRMKQMVHRLRLDGLEKRYSRELSGGQQQRVSLARSFLLQPDIMLMDEPFSALDAITREEMQDVFLSLWQEYATTTLLVTHYVEEAIYLGQQIVVLSDHPGRVYAAIDNPLFGGRNIRQSPEFFSIGVKLRDLIKKVRHSI